MAILGVGGKGVKGAIAETSQLFKKMLTLGLNITLSIVFRPKVSIFVHGSAYMY